jgi:hypothetical protein
MKWLALDNNDDDFDLLHDDVSTQAQAYSVAAERPMFDVLTGVLLP